MSSAPAKKIASEPRDLGVRLRRALQQFETEFFDSLAARGYAGFRPKHGAVFVSIDTTGSRITDMAARVGLSKPGMLQLVDELEKLGYVVRESDARDRRAKAIRPTAMLVRVLEDTASEIKHIEQRYRRRLGPRAYDSLRSTLAQLVAPSAEVRVGDWGTLWQHGRSKAAIPASAGPDIGVLLLMAMQMFDRDAFRALGRPDVRRKHLLVLHLLAREGSRATDVAERAGISKPAVVAVFDELEERGYMCREACPGDRRAKTIVLTHDGQKLLREADAVFARVERDYAKRIGVARMRSLREGLSALTA